MAQQLQVKNRLVKITVINNSNRLLQARFVGDREYHSSYQYQDQMMAINEQQNQARYQHESAHQDEQAHNSSAASRNRAHNAYHHSQSASNHSLHSGLDDQSQQQQSQYARANSHNTNVNVAASYAVSDTVEVIGRVVWKGGRV